MQPTESLPFLGRYQLQKKLAVGGMAELYLAHASGAGGFQKQVVVKRILPQLAESEELFQMFLDEARLAATLQHANIVQVYDACEDSGEFFMAMEYLDGTDLRTLRRVLAKSNMAIGWEHSLHIVSSIASGLHYAHEKCALDGTPLRIVHRDVSPQNIFLTREGSVKLVDFGIAKAEGRTTETAMGTLKGKLAYMAPEQCASEQVDRRSDIYSLGVILYELTTGRRLYSSKTEYQLINEIVEGDIRVPSTFMEYPPELERIVLTCLQKDPNDRYETARDIQADLNVFARDYQLICSTLGFSIFIEPLLEQARLDAEERCKHRREIKAIPLSVSPKKAPALGESPATERDVWVPNFQLSDPTPAPELSARGTEADAAAPLATADPRQSNRADEIIEDFLSAKHQRPPRRRVRASSAPLPVDTSYISTSANALEDLTRPVPSDMLEKLRSEERERMESEAEAAEQDAVPRIARGSVSGEISVSTNVVRRESSKNLLPLQAPPEERVQAASTAALHNDTYVDSVEADDLVIDFAEDPDEDEDDQLQTTINAADKSESGIRLRSQSEKAKHSDDEIGGKEVRLKTPSPQLLPSRAALLPTPATPPAPVRAYARASTAPPTSLADQARIATALVAPSPYQPEAEVDLSIRPKRGKLWTGLALVGGAGIAAALLLGSSDADKAAPAAIEEVAKPELGSLSVQASSPAKVWLFLGKTPVESSVTHSDSGHLVRVEHEGYHGQELRLGPANWQRDTSGERYAQAVLRLQTQETEAPEAGPTLPSTTAAEPPPKSLRLQSTPSAADAWLYVGTTPHVQIDGLRTANKVELRIMQEGEPPMYRSLPADEFDAEGRASLHLILPTAPAPKTNDFFETGDTETPATPKRAKAALGKTKPVSSSALPKKKWRPKRNKQTAPAQAPANDKSNSEELEHPVPHWAR